jgi:hypothetical protein
LQRISAHHDGQYGPVMRFTSMNRSYSLPLKNPMKISTAYP